MSAPRETREDDLALLAEMMDANPIMDREFEPRLRDAFRKFGWAMLSDEALAHVADETEAFWERHERSAAASRAHYAASVAKQSEAA